MPELTDLERLAIAERFAWLWLLMPTMNTPSMDVVEAGAATDLANIDDTVARYAQRVLANPQMDDAELRRMDRIMNAKTLDEINEAAAWEDDEDE